AIPGEVAENIIANPPEDGLAEGEDDTGSNKTPLFDGGSDDKCFIATAAFGSAMEPEVITLREFRDTMLKPHAMGRLFVNGYYWMSPPIAAFIASRPGMKAIVRYLFRPLIHIIKSHYLGR
ncbi:MAG: CFI-box-CTERM domain-containing protein, partial [Thermodesulfobacteriota bacterium]|nr:CFI-box-CTERM domain-containing protein [Thermodesulfobacteriota bacterium]